VPEPRTRLPAAEAPARRADPGRVVGLAVAMVVAGIASVTALYVVFVRTRDGQRLDQAALLRVDADPDLTRDIAGVLNDLTIGVSIAVLVAGMAVALVRGQLSHAIAAAVLVGGANVTTQVLKHGLLTRPHLGYEWTNSLPSGHTTVVVSVAMALLLVVPGISRWLLVLIGSVGATIVGVGVVVAAWHRPSDVLASLAVCLTWAGLVGLWLLVRGREQPPARRTTGHPAVALAGAVVAVALTYGYGVRPEGEWRDLVAHGITVMSIGLGTALCLSLAARVLPPIR
jgi:membrane-associated phospholipid phosphatase